MQYKYIKDKRLAKRAGLTAGRLSPEGRGKGEGEFKKEFIKNDIKIF